MTDDPERHDGSDPIGSAEILLGQRHVHTLLRRAVDRVDNAVGTEQDDYLDDMRRLFVAHVRAQESTLWPRIRPVDAAELTTLLERRRGRIETILDDLDSSPHVWSERPLLVQHLCALVRLELSSEEDDLVPVLRTALADGGRSNTVLAWRVARLLAPTRPHSTDHVAIAASLLSSTPRVRLVSSASAVSIVSTLSLVALDRTRDHLDRMSRHGPVRLARLSRTLSRALGQTAGFVEHIPASKL